MNNNQHHKNLLEFLQSLQHHWEFLLTLQKAPITKNDYRNVIDITFRSDAVPNMVAILTCNKGNS